MVYVHGMSQTMTFDNSKASVKNGLAVEMYTTRRKNWVALGIAGGLFLACGAFLIYSFFATIDDLWIYATVATGAAAVILLAVLVAVFAYSYSRISLLGPWGKYMAARDCLLVVRNRGATARGWACAAMTVVRGEGGAVHIYATGDLREVVPSDAATGRALRRSQAQSRAIRLRSMLQTEAGDLRDYLQANSVRTLALLIRKSMIGGPVG